MNKKMIALFLLSLIFVSGCIKNNYTFKARKTSISDMKAIVNASNAFAIDMYKEISKDNNNNILFSPFSIYISLSMLYDGSGTTTKEDMEKALHIPNLKKRKADTASLMSIINSRKYYIIESARSLWLQKGFDIKKNYAKTIGYYYGAKVKTINFNNSSSATKEMNSWVEESTNGTIKKLLYEEQTSKYLRFVLSDAIYFKGNWHYQFPKNQTTNETFESPNNPVNVEMMHLNNKIFNYGETKDMQIIELIYNGNISMFIILPKKDIFSFDKTLSYENIRLYEKAMSKKRISSLCIPKFNIEEGYELMPVLSDLGLYSMFSSKADFSGISDKNLSLSFVLHKASISVDEQGTRSISTNSIASNSNTLSFCANHPFIFYIKDRTTGEILFIGRVINPNNN